MKNDRYSRRPPSERAWYKRLGLVPKAEFDRDLVYPRGTDPFRSMWSGELRETGADLEARSAAQD